VLAAAGVLVLALAAGVSVDAAHLVSQVERIQIPAATAQQAGETWVIVGSDSRAATPDGPDYYGTDRVDGPTTVSAAGAAAAAGGGEDQGLGNADLILVVQVPASRDQAATLLAVPRNLLVNTVDGSERLTVTLSQGADRFAAAMCQGLGVPVDHLVVVTMQGLAGLVDALGGLTMTFDAPLIDPAAHLSLPGTGTYLLSGKEVVALVRARGADAATAASQAAETARTARGGLVAAKLAEQAQAVSGNWLTARRLVVAGAAGVAVDQGTNLFELARTLGRIEGPAQVLVTKESSQELVELAGQETFEQLEAMGYHLAGCSLEQTDG
jgi:LCP family protein required for cell wall assembly